MTIAMNPIADGAPIWLASQERIWERNGLDVTINSGIGGAAMIPSLVSGEVEVTAANPSTILIALEQGLDIVVLGGFINSTGEERADGAAILVPDDSSITRPSELDDKTLAVNTLNSILSTTSREAVRKDGGDPEAVSLVEIPFPDQLGPAGCRKRRRYRSGRDLHLAGFGFWVEGDQLAVRGNGAGSPRRAPYHVGNDCRGTA